MDGASEPARTALFEDEAASLTLSFYPPGLRQPAHAHDAPSLAILLSGTIEEQAGARTAVAQAGSTWVKADGLRHSDVYGPDGAILLTLTLRDPRLAGEIEGSGWAWGPTPLEMRRLIAEAFARRLPYSDLVPELLARSAPRPGGERRIPGWLKPIRLQLEEAPGLSLNDLAAAAGVHRVHLSRSFRRCYGESVSAFRLRRKSEIALRGLLHEGLPAASAAGDAGFADQSHFIRATRRALGLTPGRLLAMRGQGVER